MHPCVAPIPDKRFQGNNHSTIVQIQHSIPSYNPIVSSSPEKIHFFKLNSDGNIEEACLVTTSVNTSHFISSISLLWEITSGKYLILASIDELFKSEVFLLETSTHSPNHLAVRKM